MITFTTALMLLILPPVHGSINRHVVQSNLNRTACVVGWSSTVRPPVEYTTSLKIRQLQQFGYSDQNPSHYQEDHFISLSIGGNPINPNNLWPQPWSQAHRDDGLEGYWHRQLCSGVLTLRQARNTERAYKLRNG